MCVCNFVCECMCVHACVLGCGVVCVHLCMCALVCVHLCVCVHICVYVHACVWRLCVSAFLCLSACVRFACMCASICVYSCICVHVFVCVCECMNSSLSSSNVPVSNCVIGCVDDQKQIVIVTLRVFYHADGWHQLLSFHRRFSVVMEPVVSVRVNRYISHLFVLKWCFTVPPHGMLGNDFTGHWCCYYSRLKTLMLQSEPMRWFL